MSGDVDGALNVPRGEVRRHIANVFDVPEEVLGGCPPAPEPIPERPGWQGVASTLIHDALNEAVARGIAREEEVARTAILLGVGYARIETWAPMTFDWESISLANQLRVDYVITSLVPPMERFEFPNWSSFEVWRGHQERRRG